MLGDLVARAATVVTQTEPPVLFTRLGRHPRLFRSWLPFAGTLLFCGELPRVEAELAVLRTAANCCCPYEWVHHARLAARAGLTEDEIVATADSDGARHLDSHRRALMKAVDELHSARRLSPDTSRQLAAALSERQVLELCMLVGHYEMLAMTINTLGIEPETQAVAHLSRRATAAVEAIMPSGA